MAIVMGIAPMTFLRASEKTVNTVKEYVTGKTEKVAVNNTVTRP